MESNIFSRRNFLKTSAITTGLTAISSIAISNNPGISEINKGKLPREVWIAGISQMDLHARTPQLMVDGIFDILNDVVDYKPDIICLPEVFATSNIDEKPGLLEMVEISANVLQQFSGFAKRNRCYVICPVYTSENKKIYNSAVLMDRDGLRMGEYRKIHLPQDETDLGLTPGPLQPTVFQTDFGKIGIQICYDILWDDGWTRLREQGAEIVFWPSAFAGGQMINAKAWQHKCLIATSTRKNTSKLCDITGEVVAQTGIWDKNYYCAPVNLEKTFLHTWPNSQHFSKIRKKYGRSIRITNFHEEEWSIIESLSPDIFISDILQEFGLRTFEQQAADAEIAQIKVRNGLTLK